MTNVTMYWEGRELQWDPQHMDVMWMIVIEDYTHCRGMEEFWQGIGRTEAKFLQCSMYWVLSQNGDKIAPQSLRFDIGKWGRSTNTSMRLRRNGNASTRSGRKRDCPQNRGAPAPPLARIGHETT
jgi:hypothetical protein